MSRPERISEARMPGLLRRPFPHIPLGLWEHSKTGRRYVVVGGTFYATGEEQIVNVQYICPEHFYSAHRTSEDFLAPQLCVGEAIPVARFVCIQPMEGTAVLAFLLRALVANLGNILWRITRPTSGDDGVGSPSTSSVGAPAT